MGRNHQKLNNRLEQLRRKAGLTQQELSEKAEVSRKSINAIENGIYVPYYTCNHPLYTSCDDPSIFFQGVVDSQRNTHEIRVATDGQKKYVFTGGIFFDASKSENQENFNYPGYNSSFALNSPISTARYFIEVSNAAFATPITL